LGGEVDVRREQCRPHAVLDDLACAHEVEKVVGRDARRDERQRGGGDNSPRPAHVEGDERHATRAECLRKQDSRDQEAGEDEEDVDTDVAALQERDAGVSECDEEDGDRA
jgi:hypothetical protein